MSKDWKDISVEDMGWGDYGFRMLITAIMGFSLAITFTSIYIVSVGYGLASFFYWAFTTNFWIPVEYHTWFIIATIPFVNVFMIALAIIALALKFSIIYFVLVVLPLIFEGIMAWGTNIFNNLMIMVNSGQLNGTEADVANSTLNIMNNFVK